MATSDARFAVCPYCGKTLVNKNSWYKHTCENQPNKVLILLHSYIRRLMTKSFYKLKDCLSKKVSKKQHEGILKINAFAVKIKKK